ncbi:hypothetical protein CU669_19000 [Paramagnetospirillum kuznetsovii]|uniref:Spore protein YkvP/CgeB glycosyl transferase-like domain-containing protein n=1 Tax=Paramagnetospirillum kuznetsovii TaxID=2053833 RepID=A0A364NTD6_9PROT|nr:glycosyltransferase [Paramagnetospirillum kuznetsovii]RAU20334.1 hypothetical protein CU669_19000 [Paramagnetospirillum kuznetsovii]
MMSTIINLSESNRISDIRTAVIRKNPDSNELEECLLELLRRRMWAEASEVALAAVALGSRDWRAYIVSATKQLGDKNYAAANQLVELMSELPTTQDIKQEELTYEPAAMMVIINIISAVRNHFSGVDFGQLWGWTNLLKAVSPPVLAMTDGIRDQRSIADKIVEARSARPMIRLPERLGEPRLGRKVVVGMKERFFPERANSRLSDMPARIVSAMKAYGWDVTFVKFGEAGKNTDIIQTLIETSQQLNPDLILLDVEYDDFHTDILKTVRDKLPHTMLISFYADPWKDNIPIRIREVSSIVDGFWSVNPSLEIWTENGVREKAIFFPWLHGGYRGGTDVSLQNPGYRFLGGIEIYNWPRAIWALESFLNHAPISFDISRHAEDGLDALTSFHRYLDRLAEVRGCVNFSTRRDFRKTLTARVFEALQARTLLIQEASDELDYYLVDGRDYLSFANFDELMEVIAFSDANPDVVGEIVANGHRLATTTYGDNAIIGYFDSLIERHWSLSGAPVV